VIALTAVVTLPSSVVIGVLSLRLVT